MRFKRPKTAQLMKRKRKLKLKWKDRKNHRWKQKCQRKLMRRKQGRPKWKNCPKMRQWHWLGMMTKRSKKRMKVPKKIKQQSKRRRKSSKMIRIFWRNSGELLALAHQVYFLKVITFNYCSLCISHLLFVSLVFLNLLFVV